MLTWSNCAPWIILVLCCYIYTKIDQNKENFVPSNSYESNQLLSPEDQTTLRGNFGKLMDFVNGTEYQTSYNLDNTVDFLMRVLNNTGIGKYKLVSIGRTLPFTLVDVQVQNVETKEVNFISRVDFLVTSINPTKVSRVILTPKSNSETQISSESKLRKPLTILTV